MTNYQQARQVLGARLRELRADTGLSGRDLAELLNWSPSKVSRIELGRQTPSRADVTAWANGVQRPDIEPELQNRLRTLESHYAAWRRQLAAGVRARQEAYGAEERNSEEVRNFEAAVIPGLLQTPDYTRHLLTGITELVQSPPDVEGGVQARQRRQQVLYEPGRQFHFLIWEAALRTLLCPPEVMTGQLDRLAGVVGLFGVTLGVVPASAPLRISPHHGFIVYDQRLVRVETAAAELSIVEDSEIAVYMRLWDHLAAAAAYNSKAQRLIARARAELPDT
ncbi:MAG: helix-turn-helix domain-containing protein [Pseudonocardiaceae bacterium]|nr:helix-turn-helix domain-containing protein [Pseudonocardiaceae bacterium]